MNLIGKANNRKINTELSKNNYFLERLNLIKFELNKIYQSGDKEAKSIQEIRKIQIDLDIAEKAIEKIEFLDLFDQNVFKQLAVDNIVRKINILVGQKDVDFPDNFIEKINLYYENINEYKRKLNPFVIAFNNLGNINSKTSIRAINKHYIENLRIISQTISYNIDIIPLLLLQGVKEISSVLLDTDFTVSKMSKKDREVVQDIKAYCYFIVSQIDSFQRKTGKYIDNREIEEDFAWENENRLYDLMFEDLKADSHNSTLEDDREIDEIINRLSQS